MDERDVPAQAARAGSTAGIRTPDQRLRVFISSTLSELAAERRAAGEAIGQLRLTPVMFELGARAHPPRALYRSYLEQSDVFVGIYWQQYGWVAPGEDVSGVEDEYLLSAHKPRLLYVRDPAPRREPRLAGLLRRVQADDTSSYKHFSKPAELRRLVADDLALLMTERFTGAPAAGSTAVAPGLTLELPAPPNRLVDRTAELEQIASALAEAQSRLVTLVGPGGIGKTRLAIAAASAFRERERLPAGFISLASIRDPELVPDAIATAIGVPVGLGGAEPALLAALADPEALLVVDNLEQVIRAGPFLARLLAALPRLRLLATSREPLRIAAEREVPVPPLPIEPDANSHDGDGARPGRSPAVELFVDRAEAIRPGITASTDPALLEEIVRRLDGVPLVIELAAARTRLLPPAALLERLGSRLDLLTGGARDLPERQRTLRATLDWSHDLLEPDEARLFARLSVFPGGARLGAVEQVCGEGITGDLLDLVASLVDKSLVLAMPSEGEPRVRMLAIVREYAADQLARSGEAARVEDRRDEALEALVGSVRHALRSPNQVRALQLLADEVDNLRAVIERSLANGAADRVVRIAWSAWQFWWRKGHLTEARGWLDQLAKSGMPEGLDTDHRAWFDAAQAITLFWLGRLTEARPYTDAAIDGMHRLDEPDSLATLLLARAMIAALSGGDLDAAAADVQEARRLTETADASWLLGFVWNTEAYLATAGGDTDAAVAALEKSAAAAQSAGDQVAGVVALDTLARVHLDRGEVAQAARRFRETLAMGLGLGLSERFGFVLMGVASVLHAVGNDDAAARFMGVSDGSREAIAATWLFPEAAVRWDTLRRELRAGLGDEEFEAAWHEGRATGVDAMAAAAMIELDRIATSSPQPEGAEQ